MQDFPTSPDPHWPQQPPSPYPPIVAPPPTPPPTPPPAPATPGAPGTRPSNRNKILLGSGIGCGLLLVLCMCAGLVSALAARTPSTAGDAPTATTAPQSHISTPAGTPQPTATPKPTATATPAPKWVVTHTYKGNGIQKTDTFTVDSDHWKIRWSCNPQAYGFEYNLIADLTAPRDDFGDSVVNVICKANDPSSTAGETNEYSPGTFFLDVTSEASWTFQIEEFK